jgi:GT2 family glycosyltransferase
VLTEDTDYVWLLNNDTTVEPDALRHLVMTAQSDVAVGAVGCPIYDMKHRTDLRAWGGGRLSVASGWGGPVRRRVDPGRLSYLTAASMLIRVQALRQVGLFDEGFFMYYEDIDLCLRFRRAGWKLAVADHAIVYHKEGASFHERWGLRDALVTRSEVRFFRKYAPIPGIPILVRAGLRCLKRLARGEWSRCWAVAISALETLRSRRHEARRRGPT